MSRGVLYVSYSGMLEPLGQSQVLAYQERIAKSRPVHIVSYERTRDWHDLDRRAQVAQRMARAGIQWHPLRYHKRPALAATAWDVARGIAMCRRLVRLHDLRIVHARSYVPGLVALATKRLTGARFLFDMRGFWADERVDGGLWRRDGVLHDAGKRLERRLLRAADHVVALTHAAVDEMRRWPAIGDSLPTTSVIPTCTDLQRFTPKPWLRDREFVLGYVGSVGTWYLFDDVLRSFMLVRRLRPDAKLLVLNRGEHAHVRERAAAMGIAPGSFELREVDHRDIALQIARMHAAVSFILPAYSKLASAPTRLGELLGCGVPCLANAGIGDTQRVLEGERVGVVVSAFDEAALMAGLVRLLELAQEPGITNRCAGAARRHFALERGVDAYRAIYDALDAAA